MVKQGKKEKLLSNKIFRKTVKPNGNFMEAQKTKNKTKKNSDSETRNTQREIAKCWRL